MTLSLPVLLLFTSKLDASGTKIHPSAETLISPYPGDSLDDAAVWQHPSNPDESLIVTTLKASNQTPVQPTGIITYDLKGNQVQFFEDGTPNNVDVRAKFPFPTGDAQIIAVSHWYSGEIGLYRIDSSTRKLIKIASFTTSINKLRGLCLGRLDQQTHAFAIGSDGDIEQYQIDSVGNPVLVKQWQLASEAEGCVVNDSSQKLYIAEENHGIWSIDLNQANPAPEIFDEIRLFGPLKRGLEGLTLLDIEQETFLIASIQEKNRFAIYNLSSDQYLGKFKISASGQLDGVSKTDGIHIEQFHTTDFPLGILITHDDSNLDDAGKETNQNFKLIELGSLIELIKKRNSGSRK